MIQEDRWDSLKKTVKDEADALDRFIAESLSERAAAGKKIFCAAGCSHCCTLFVQATLVEALIVAEQLDDTQFRQLEEYIGRQRESLAGENDFLAVLRKQRAAIGPCPFLDQSGCCSIYALRPLACRALLSTKPAEWCGIDFSTLDPLEKRLYLASLDRDVVAFPVHYLVHPQNVAQCAEKRIMELIRDQLGVAVSGNFPLLVYLSFPYDIKASINSDVANNWLSKWQESVAAHPLLLQMKIAKN